MAEELNAVGVLTDRLTESSCSRCGCLIDVSQLEPFTPFACPQCGTEQKVPARLGSFLLVDLIGTGGMGGVYYAKDEALGRFVAIKVMLRSLGENVESVETFKREAQAVAKLNHPNIVQIYSFGQEKGQPYIVMELVSGEHFDKMVESDEPLDPAIVVQIILDITAGLKAADDIGLLHGDIKPENILMDDKWHAKLVDFGLSSFVNQAAEGGVWGTPYYIAPEKVRRRKVDARSDIYSLGATMYHALAGRPPFDGETPAEVVRARLDKLPPPLSTVRPGINPELDRILARMLDPEPGRRYPTYDSLMSDLRRVLDALGGPKDLAKAMARMKKRFTKKISSPISTDTTNTEAAAEPPARTGKGARIVIRKSAGGVSPIDEYRKSAKAASQAAEEDWASGAKKRKTNKVFVAIGLLILAAIGGTAIAMRAHEKKVQQERILAIAAALQSEQTGAAKLVTEIQLAVTGMVAKASAAEADRARATNAVYVVMGREIDLAPPPEPEPVAPPAAAPEAPPAPLSGETQQVAGATGALIPPPAVTSVTAEAVAPALTNAPALETPQVPEEPIVVLGREVFVKLQTASRNIAAARLIEKDAVDIGAKVLQSTATNAASRIAKPLFEKAAAVRELAKSTAQALTDADTAAAKAEKMAAATAKDREAKKLREAEEARQQAAEEARKRQAEALAAKADEEVANAAALATETLPSIKKNNYAAAVNAVTAKLPDYATDKGKAAVQVLIDRCKRLEDLKTFLIERLNTDPPKWGWTQGRSPEDVTGADASGVKIRTGTVPWEQVGVPQMLSFIRRYMDSRDVSAKALGDANLGAAIYCFENGGAEASLTFADKAVALRPTLADDVKRLLPSAAQP